MKFAKLIYLVSFAALPLFADTAPAVKVDTGLPNPSARPQIATKYVDIFADFLYWKASEVADWATVISIHQDTLRTHYKTLSLDWKPGFRIGLGYEMAHDQWDTQIYYTYYRSHTTKHAHSNIGRVTPAFLGTKISLLSLLGDYESGKLRYELAYDILDWDLGRSFFVSKGLAFRPVIGLKGGWIDQSFHTHWKNIVASGIVIPITSKEKLLNNFGGGGPKAGIGGKWIFAAYTNLSFQVVGDFAAAFMWGHWDLTDKFRDSLGTEVVIKNGRRNFGAWMLQGFLGLGMDLNFNQERSHFSLNAGYEIQDWFNQFQLIDLTTGTEDKDLLLQGLTLDIRFDF